MKVTAQRVVLAALGVLAIGGGAGVGFYLYGSRMAAGYKVAYTFTARYTYGDVKVSKGDMVRLVGRISDAKDGVAKVQWDDVYNFSVKDSPHFPRTVDSSQTPRTPQWVSTYMGSPGVAPMYFAKDMPDTFDVLTLTKIGLF
jgi:hypothetical protein